MEMTATVTKAKAKANGAGKPPESDESAIIQIDPIPVETILVPILGTSPLIMHRFAEKARKELLDGMTGKKTPKTRKNPEAEYQACFYWRKEGEYGFPSSAFKLATIDASRFYGKDVTAVGLRQFMFVFGEGHHELARIEAITEPVMREDVVRVGRGGTDLRYRPMFNEWRSEIEVTYVTSALTRSSVLSLIDAGGMGIGVGDWRVERDGIYGTYRVDPDRAVEVLR